MKILKIVERDIYLMVFFIKIPSSRKRYILDGIFIKNISYYYLRSKTPESDLRNTKLLAEVKIKLKEVTKRGKGKYIQKLKEKKMAND